ncbi:MAG: cytochrome c biogenesis protein CcsA [Planctomycetota bacterium]
MSALAITTITSGWLAASICLYGMTALVSGMGTILRKPVLWRAGVWLLLAGFAANGFLLGAMWVNTGKPPFQTRYETLLLYSFWIALVGLVLAWLHQLWRLPTFAAMGALACLYFAYQRPDLKFVALPPALQSGWFVPHVVTYFIGYAGLFNSCVLAAMALYKARKQNRQAKDADSESSLEAASHKATIFGFTTLTFGLAMGAVWGKTAWGDYWSWDPKENWAFITWLAYLSYIHIRLMGQWRGKPILWFNLLCFAAAMFTYLGMHLLPTANNSMHLYQ